MSADSIILEEEIDPNYEPSIEEIIEYAHWIGMDRDKDKDLFWIAREALLAPLPADWKPCKIKGSDDIYYFNFATGESKWDHPSDEYYKTLFLQEKEKIQKNHEPKYIENPIFRGTASNVSDKILVSDSPSKTNELKSEITVLNSIINTRNETIADLKHSISLLQEKLLSANEDMKVLPSLKLELSKLQTTIEFKDKDINMLKSNLLAAENINTNLETTIKQLTYQLDRVNNEKVSIEKQISSLQQLNQLLESKLSLDSNDNIQLTQKYNDYKEKFDVIFKDNEDLRKKLESFQDLQCQFELKNSNFENLNKENQNLNNKIDMLKTEIKDLKSYSDELLDRIQLLTKQLSDASMSNNDLRAKLSESERTDSKSCDYDALQSIILSLQNKVNSLNDEVVSKTSTILNQQLEFNAAKQEHEMTIQEYKRQIDKLIAESKKAYDSNYINAEYKNNARNAIYQSNSVGDREEENLLTLKLQQKKIMFLESKLYDAILMMNTNRNEIKYEAPSIDKSNKTIEFISHVRVVLENEKKRLLNLQREVTEMKEAYKASKLHIQRNTNNISSKTINQKTLQLNKSLEDYRVCEEWLLRNEEKLLQKEHVKFSLPNEIRNLFIEYDPNISNFDLMHENETSFQFKKSIYAPSPPLMVKQNPSRRYLHVGNSKDIYDRNRNSQRYEKVTSDKFYKEISSIEATQRRNNQIYDQHTDWLASLRNELIYFGK